MPTYRTKSPLDAARFVRLLTERGYVRVGGTRAVSRGCYRIGKVRRGWLRVIFNEPEGETSCSTEGHESKPARARGLCDRCWRRWKYANDPDWRERRKESARKCYAKLTPEQREARKVKQRVAAKRRRWAMRRAA